MNPTEYCNNTYQRASRDNLNCPTMSYILEVIIMTENINVLKLCINEALIFQ